MVNKDVYIIYAVQTTEINVYGKLTV